MINPPKTYSETITLRDEIAATIRKGNLNAEELSDLEAGLVNFYQSAHYKTIKDHIYPDFTIPTLLAHKDIGEPVALLIDLGVDMTKVDLHHQSPALVASAAGSRKFLKALHEADVDILAPVNKIDAFDVARNDETCQTILELTGFVQRPEIADRIEGIVALMSDVSHSKSGASRVEKIERAIQHIEDFCHTYQHVPHFQTYITDLKSIAGKTHGYVGMTIERWQDSQKPATEQATCDM